jgi:hypothetical protein
MDLNDNLACRMESLSKRTLIEAGVSLKENPDKLMWTGGDSSGIISVKNIYLALVST